MSDDLPRSFVEALTFSSDDRNSFTSYAPVICIPSPYDQGLISRQNTVTLIISYTRVVRKVLRQCLYLKVICMLYNKIHTDEEINVLCGTVEKKIESKNEYCWRYSSPRQPV